MSRRLRGGRAREEQGGRGSIIATGTFPGGVPLPGTAGKSVSRPHAASLNVTDLDVSVDMLPTSAVSGTRTLAAKFSGTGWIFQIYPSAGAWTMYFYAGGSISASASATVPAGTSLFRVTRTAVDGVIRFWSGSAFGAWSQIGTDRTSGTGSTPTSASAFVLGAYSTDLFEGRVRRALLLGGVGGSPVADFNSALARSTGYTDAYGGVWTVTL